VAWYLRKAVGLGPLLRLNISRGGIGIAAGVKGLRAGVDARGRRYVAGGRWASTSGSASAIEPPGRQRWPCAGA
jgi:hypothetical protein